MRCSLTDRDVAADLEEVTLRVCGGDGFRHPENRLGVLGLSERGVTVKFSEAQRAGVVAELMESFRRPLATRTAGGFQSREKGQRTV